MKIIFLDIDGVLVNRKSIMASKRIPHKFDKDCVQLLNKIITVTGASVVVSSVWRRLYDCRQLLSDRGVKNCVGCIPNARLPTRGQEIQSWLDNHERVTNFVILDDDADMGSLSDRLVQTKFELGLTKADAEKAIKILTKEGS